MALNDFRSVHLPYCLDRQEDGSYVVLNREYKPLGFQTYNHIDYSTYPVAVKFARKLSDAQVRKLSWKGDTDPSKIYLYNDGCIPTSSTEAMEAYLKRITLLAKLKLKAIR